MSGVCQCESKSKLRMNTEHKNDIEVVASYDSNSRGLERVGEG